MQYTTHKLVGVSCNASWWVCHAIHNTQVGGCVMQYTTHKLVGASCNTQHTSWWVCHAIHNTQVGGCVMQYTTHKLVGASRNTSWWVCHAISIRHTGDQRLDLVTATRSYRRRLGTQNLFDLSLNLKFIDLGHKSAAMGIKDAHTHTHTHTPFRNCGNRRLIGMTRYLLELENSGHDGGRSCLRLLARAYLDVTSQGKPRSPQCKSMASVIRRITMGNDKATITQDWLARSRSHMHQTVAIYKLLLSI